MHPWYGSFNGHQGTGEGSVTLAVAQAWCLLAQYEACNTFFPRTWLSIGKAARLCQTLGLQRIDHGGVIATVKEVLPPTKDWIELEERRRTFWVAFYCDRWASTGTAWPMAIQESEVSWELL